MEDLLLFNVYVLGHFLGHSPVISGLDLLSGLTLVCITCGYMWPSSVEGFSVGSQAGAANTPPSKGVSNGQGTPPSDLVDLPKLKGIGRNRRARFSLYRHLQKHTMQHADSVSSVDSAGVCLVRNRREADIEANCE